MNEGYFPGNEFGDENIAMSDELFIDAEYCVREGM